ncbi:MAG: GyrI-like domain-containing protein [Bacteroidota bacterium]
MKKIDLKKELKYLYVPSPKEVVAVEVPKFNFLMIDGKGDPDTSQEFQNAVEALYSVSYTLKFTIKKEDAIDYPVMPLEGLWWMKDMKAFDWQKKDEWRWTMMIMQPKYVTAAKMKQALKAVSEKKDLPALPLVRFEAFDEGLSVQVLHIGPYAAEAPTIIRMHDFASAQGYELHGKHHEIYLGDPRKSAPEKLKTGLRQPVRKQKKG